MVYRLAFPPAAGLVLAAVEGLTMAEPEPYTPGMLVREIQQKRQELLTLHGAIWRDGLVHGLALGFCLGGLAALLFVWWVLR
jgi:hypothetical protein